MRWPGEIQGVERWQALASAGQTFLPAHRRSGCRSYYYGAAITGEDIKQAVAIAAATTVLEIAMEVNYSDGVNAGQQPPINANFNSGDPVLISGGDADASTQRLLMAGGGGSRPPQLVNEKPLREAIGQSFDQMRESLDLHGQLKVFQHNVDVYNHYWEQHTDMMREIYGRKGDYIITHDKLMIKEIVLG